MVQLQQESGAEKGKGTDCTVVFTTNERLRSHGIGEQGSIACELRPLLIALFMVESGWSICGESRAGVF